MTQRAEPHAANPSDVAELAAAGGRAPYLRVARVSRAFETGSKRHSRQLHWAVRQVSFHLRRAETLGIIGHSGAGKTTLGRCILRIDQPTSGRVAVAGREITHLVDRDLRKFRRHMQVMFRNVTSSLNPLLTARDIVGEPLLVHDVVGRDEQESRVREALELVELPVDVLERVPPRLSYAERKLVSLARTLVTRPELVVYDEPFEGLDPSSRSQVVRVLVEQRRGAKQAGVVLSHDLAAVRAATTRTAVMYQGRFVEIAPTESLFARRAHPYTRELLMAERGLRPARRNLEVVVEPSDSSEPTGGEGCSFAPSCPRADARCFAERPKLDVLQVGHRVACHYPVT